MECIRATLFSLLVTRHSLFRQQNLMAMHKYNKFVRQSSLTHLAASSTFHLVRAQRARFLIRQRQDKISRKDLIAFLSFASTDIG